jgi:hypothetical protein
VASTKDGEKRGRQNGEGGGRKMEGGREEGEEKEKKAISLAKTQIEKFLLEFERCQSL